jgi:hypothetical protein
LIRELYGGKALTAKIAKEGPRRSQRKAVGWTLGELCGIFFAIFAVKSIWPIAQCLSAD